MQTWGTESTFIGCVKSSIHRCGSSGQDRGNNVVNTLSLVVESRLREKGESASLLLYVQST